MRIYFLLYITCRTTSDYDPHGGSSTAPTRAREGPASLFTVDRRQSITQELLGATYRGGSAHHRSGMVLCAVCCCFVVCCLLFVVVVVSGNKM
jgi:hypothetical protein